MNAARFRTNRLFIPTVGQARGLSKNGNPRLREGAAISIRNKRRTARRSDTSRTNGAIRGVRTIFPGRRPYSLV